MQTGRAERTVEGQWKGQAAQWSGQASRSVNFLRLALFNICKTLKTCNLAFLICYNVVGIEPAHIMDGAGKGIGKGSGKGVGDDISSWILVVDQILIPTFWLDTGICRQRSLKCVDRTWCTYWRAWSNSWRLWCSYRDEALRALENEASE